MKTAIRAVLLSVPCEFRRLFNYARELRYDQKPNCRFLKRIFKDLARPLEIELDKPFNDHSVVWGRGIMNPPLWPATEEYASLGDTDEEKMGMME